MFADSKSSLSRRISFGSSSFGIFGLALEMIFDLGLQRRMIDSANNLSLI